MLVLKNCKLIPELTEGTDLTMADILIDGRLIADILPCGTEISAPHEVQDLEGKTVLPGLINGHIHIFGGDNPASPSAAVHAPLCGLRFSQYLLKNGYTTLRSCSDYKQFPAVALRDEINAGNFEGPTLLTSGPMIAPTEIPFDIPWGQVCDTVDDVRRSVRNSLANGADFIKIYASGSMSAPGKSDPDICIMAEDEIRESVKIAEMKGTYVASHCHSAKAMDACVRNGVRTIEHATFVKEETLQLMEGRSDVGIIMTISPFMPFITKNAEPYKSMMARMIECQKNAYAHDVLIGWGTDITMEVQKAEVGGEFRYRKELLGFDNLDLLKQATINTAKLLMIDDEVGSIKTGKKADLVIIDGDPVKDISLMYTAPASVIKHGAVVK